jgi:hypothetical protein
MVGLVDHPASLFPNFELPTWIWIREKVLGKIQKLLHHSRKFLQVKKYREYVVHFFALKEKK